MDERCLYQRIAEGIRQEILAGRLRAGDRLPSIRTLSRQWNCTAGTIQRAFQELANQGLVTSQAGKGTHVSGQIGDDRYHPNTPLRLASLVHRAESFLLESLTAGYGMEEIQQAIDLARDHWRTLQTAEVKPANSQSIRFVGSHDMLMIWISGHMAEIVHGVDLRLNFTGSLGGLMALAEGKAEIAGCHLWDAESDRYNEPFIRKFFPGKPMLVVRLVNRRTGMIVRPGNPMGLQRIGDLARSGVRFVNRQSGSGTRVLLDANLRSLKIDPAQICGYGDEKSTHSEVARTIAEGKADAGIGLESAAAVFNLDFIPLVEESYDLVTYPWLAEQEPLSSLLGWLSSGRVKGAVPRLPGYDFSHTGERKVLQP